LSGAVIWLTGLPAAGKTTLAAALANVLNQRGQPAVILDGDTLRAGPHRDLGFSAEDRAEHVRRVAVQAAQAADAGQIAIVAVIAPLRDMRATARHLAAPHSFHEIHIATSLEECERRDPKGLYRKSRAGLLKGFTGIDAPYEEPEHPDLRIDTAVTSVGDAVTAILRRLNLTSP